MSNRAIIALVVGLSVVVIGGVVALRMASARVAQAANQVQSVSQMHILGLAVGHYYEDHNQKWPDRLSAIADYVEGEKKLAELMRNPVTGDELGYEYVKPKDRPGAEVILYQLRDGKRDLTLRVGLSDGRVLLLDETGQPITPAYDK